MSGMLHQGVSRKYECPALVVSKFPGPIVLFEQYHNSNTAMLQEIRLALALYKNNNIIHSSSMKISKSIVLLIEQYHKSSVVILSCYKK